MSDRRIDPSGYFLKFYQWLVQKKHFLASVGVLLPIFAIFQNCAMQVTGSRPTPTSAAPSVDGCPTSSFIFSSATSGTTLLVPNGCVGVVAKVWGAGGGSSGSNHGGGGAFTQSTLSVTAGQSLFIQVGGAGISGTITPGTSSAGGVNGGGQGGIGSSVSGSGGGGYSAITIDGSLSLLSGGGGGAAYQNDGGDAGGPDASPGTSLTSGNEGAGATQIAGGLGGLVGVVGNPTGGTSGTQLLAGDGGSNVVAAWGGGGGGGGFYGGGGGSTASYMIPPHCALCDPLPAVSSPDRIGSGGGGSSFNPIMPAVFAAGNSGAAGNAGDSEWISPHGNSGSDGLVVIKFLSTAP